MKGSQAVAMIVVLLLIGGLIAAKAMKGQAPANVPAGGPSNEAPAPPGSSPAAEENAVAVGAAEPGESGAEPSKKDALPQLLELGSVGCMPCQYMAPIIDSLEKELAGKVVVKFHDVNRDPTMAEKYQVKVIPTQVFLDADGNELFRHTGVFEKAEILAKLRELGMLKE